MRRPMAALATILLLTGLFVPAAAAAPVAPISEDATPSSALSSGQLQLHFVTSGFSSPLGVVNAGDGTNRLFVIEKRGTVRVVANRQVQPGFFLDIRSNAYGLTTGGERGLLGLAFHPDFDSNRKLFVYFTDGQGDLQVAEMTANSAKTSVPVNTLDPIISEIDHTTYDNHNGGDLHFDDAGDLYIFTGDGGLGNDPFEASQNIDSRLGKILRVTPNLSGGATIPGDNPYVGAPGDDSVWAIGLRNPWRNSFDRGTGTLYIADVGQGVWEEINRDSDLGGGRNYGWDECEGIRDNEGDCDNAAYTDPIAVYGHEGGNCSVTGGYVYRGSIYTDMVGEYVLGDFCSGRMWTITHGSSSLVFRRDTGAVISSFGESEGGEIYLTDYSGNLFKVVAPPFNDVASSIFVDEITWLEGQGITGGCGGGRYCPTGYVYRAQMASFLVRALDLPYTETDYFTDDEGLIYEADINALAAAGIGTGCGAGRFCPGQVVTRAQMASFLVRGFELAPSGTNYFTDDNSSIHEDDINALRASGITGGCTATTYCPTSPVTREQMAAFLYRALPH